MKMTLSHAGRAFTLTDFRELFQNAVTSRKRLRSRADSMKAFILRGATPLITYEACFRIAGVEVRRASGIYNTRARAL
jgi:hypothetical protein